MNHEDIFRVTTRKFLKPVVPFMDDPTVTEIMINGPAEVYVERRGMLEKTDARFLGEEALQSAARNIAQYTHKRITPLTARLDSRLPDGSRVHIVFPRCSRQGICIAIRRFAEHAFSLDDLVAHQALTPEAREYLEIVVAAQKNLIVSGGTGAGKTTLLNALSAKIPAHERIITIEDTAELRLQQPHKVSLETAPPDRHGNGEVKIRDLFHSALRMRPDRIVIGECRAGEALDLIQAMTSGHGGSMSSLHAETAAQALTRLETMTMMAGLEMPLAALRSQIASAINVIVQMNRLPTGERKITEIVENAPLDNTGNYRVNRIFALTVPNGDDDDAPPVLAWTKNHSLFADDLRNKGLARKPQLTREVFSNVLS